MYTKVYTPPYSSPLNWNLDAIALPVEGKGYPGAGIATMMKGAIPVGAAFIVVVVYRDQNLAIPARQPCGGEDPRLCTKKQA